MSNFPITILMVSAAGFLASGGYALFASPPKPSTPQTMIVKSGVITQDNSDCRIKGNIQVGTGTRIYHVPGQAYYDETVVSPTKGERWFCSEAEAQAAGWRKSKL